jgi:hypothetical protein
VVRKSILFFEFTSRYTPGGREGLRFKGEESQEAQEAQKQSQMPLVLAVVPSLFLWGFKLQTGDLFRRHQGDARDLESQREKERSLAQISIDVSPSGLTCRARERLRRP